MLISCLLIFLIAILLGILIIPLTGRLALKVKMAAPAGIPYLGGLGIWFSFFIASLIGLITQGFLTREIQGILLSSTLMIAFGLIDDYRELSVFLKFLVQFLACCLLIFFGVKIQIAFLGPYLSVMVTFLWVLGITNAFNHLDILDGLSAGIAIMVGLTLFFIAIFSFNSAIALIVVALAGATIGFLRYNLPPAKIYMGNSGSHFLGFVLAAVAIAISYAPTFERKIALLSPMLVLGLPIYDTSFLMLMRLIQGKSVFKKSDDHFALRLLAKGHTKRKALLFMYSFCLVFSISGLILTRCSSTFGMALFASIIIVCLVIGRRIGRVSVDD